MTRRTQGVLREFKWGGADHDRRVLFPLAWIASVCLLTTAISLNAHGHAVAGGGGIWDDIEQRSYGWPWFACTLSFHVRYDCRPLCRPRTILSETCEPIASMSLMRIPTSISSSTVFLIPLIATLSWWAVGLWVYCRAVGLPTHRRSVSWPGMRFSLTDFLLVQTLVAVAIAFGSR